MNGGFEYLDIIVLAAVAIFIAYRLWSVLGQRTGKERPFDPLARPPRREAAPPANPAARPAAERGNVVALPGPSEADRKVPGLYELKQADRGFDANKFLEGARWAYEMIVEAFAAGNETALKPLLSGEVFASFAKTIAERKANGLTAQTTLAGIRSAEIARARVQGPEARVEVHFVADAVSVVRNQAQEVVEGHPTAVRELNDLWTFARDIRSRDPNWILVETGTAA